MKKLSQKLTSYLAILGIALMLIGIAGVIVVAAHAAIMYFINQPVDGWFYRAVWFGVVGVAGSIIAEHAGVSPKAEGHE